MGESRPEGHITHLRNKRMEDTSRRQRRMESSADGGHGQEGAVAPFNRRVQSHCDRLFFCPSFFVDVTFLGSNF